MPKATPGQYEELLRSFGVSLRRMREAAGLSQRDIAAKHRLGQHMISAAENGRARLRLETMCLLAEAVRGEVLTMLMLGSSE